MRKRHAVIRSVYSHRVQWRIRYRGQFEATKCDVTHLKNIRYIRIFTNWEWAIGGDYMYMHSTHMIPHYVSGPLSVKCMPCLIQLHKSCLHENVMQNTAIYI